MNITCIVDNKAKSHSNLLSEHGLSFLIKSNNEVVMFDTGKTEEVFINNLFSLGYSALRIKYIALSHAHHDHTGGLNYLLTKNHQPTIFANPDFFTPRYAFRNGEYLNIGMKITSEEVTSRATCILSANPVEIIPGLWTTGVITNRAEPMGSNSDHCVPKENGWIPDPYLDDMSLVLKTVNGLVLICGCCHAGILNTLNHVRQCFSEQLHTIIGGIHLVSAKPDDIEHVIDVLQQEYPAVNFFLNHCTGDAALSRFVEVFEDRVFECPAGTVLEFQST